MDFRRQKKKILPVISHMLKVNGPRHPKARSETVQAAEGRHHKPHDLSTNPASPGEENALPREPEEPAAGLVTGESRRLGPTRTPNPKARDRLVCPPPPPPQISPPAACSPPPAAAGAAAATTCSASASPSLPCSRSPPPPSPTTRCVPTTLPRGLSLPRIQVPARAHPG